MCRRGASLVPLEMNFIVFCEYLCAVASVILWKGRGVSVSDMVVEGVLRTCLRPWEILRVIVEAMYGGYNTDSDRFSELLRFFR